jgi:hypothetical protein
MITIMITIMIIINNFYTASSTYLLLFFLSLIFIRPEDNAPQGSIRNIFYYLNLSGRRKRKIFPSCYYFFLDFIVPSAFNIYCLLHLLSE